MSIKVMSYVWEHSQQKGSDLLTLLAIADYAHDDGTQAYPSVMTLAKKTRLSERNVQYVLRKLEESGELVIQANAGPHGCHLYRIPLASPVPPSSLQGGAKLAPGPKAPVQAQQKAVQPSVQLPPQIAPNPSLDPSRKDPSSFSSSLTKEKKEDGLDETSPWSKAPVPWTRPYPEGMLDKAALPPEDYAALYHEAKTALLTEGVKEFCLTRPVIEARMSLLLEDRGSTEVSADGCLHEHVDETDVCKDCGEVLVAIVT